ncbi:MAG: nicotinate (nicotinamide) nucleotide adenylyltransferase [Flavihumibacter sp.]|nr:nicotinate (nicotinamide) nucleotide adenylyltransferase [Flavihumibacter sp.]
MNIGLYFGSFNPLHIGHCIIANYTLQNAPIDQVWLVVSPHNPFKKEANLLNEYQRLHLAKLAFVETPDIRVVDIEFGLPKPSYTIDTMVYIKEKYPEHVFSIILGSDGFQNIHQWKNAEVLVRNYQFIVYKRPGFDIINKNIKINYLELEAPLLDISSTKIRQYIKERKSIKFMTPDTVLKEIEASNYYRS